jgi:hypothetical protein
MPTRISRNGLAVLMALVIAGFGLISAAPTASADTIIPINWTVNASTTLKSLNLSVTVPPGTFVGQVDLTTGALTGNLTLPPAAKTISLAGIPLATATFAMKENGPITGHVDLATQTVTVNTSFTFSITSATLSLAPRLNLVGNNCRGVSPISVDMSGPVNLTGSSTFSSTYTVPKFTGCGLLLTPILNLIIPGSGNTFTATFAPPAS